MANVTIKGWGVKMLTEPVGDYIAASTVSYRDGAAEMALDQADNVSRTVGRLVEALIDNGVLDRADLEYIAGKSAPTVTRLRRKSNAEV